MAQAKPYKLREMSPDELVVRRSELNEELFNLRFAASTRSLDNPLRVKMAKKEIARINTILHEKELGVREGEAGKGAS